MTTIQQLSGSTPVYLFNNLAIIKEEGSAKHFGAKPFLWKVALMNIASSMEIPADAKENIRDDKGTKKCKEFVSESLDAPTAEKIILYPIYKMKLKTFILCPKKTSFKVIKNWLW